MKCKLSVQNSGVAGFVPVANPVTQAFAQQERVAAFEQALAENQKQFRQYQ